MAESLRMYTKKYTTMGFTDIARELIVDYVKSLDETTILNRTLIKIAEYEEEGADWSVFASIFTPEAMYFTIIHYGDTNLAEVTVYKKADHFEYEILNPSYSGNSPNVV